MTRLHLLSRYQLRTRAVQDAIYVVVFGLGMLMVAVLEPYAQPISWRGGRVEPIIMIPFQLMYFLPGLPCLYNLIDLARVVGIMRGREKP